MDWIGSFDEIVSTLFHVNHAYGSVVLYKVIPVDSSCPTSNLNANKSFGTFTFTVIGIHFQNIVRMVNTESHSSQNCKLYAQRYILLAAVYGTIKWINEFYGDLPPPTPAVTNAWLLLTRYSANSNHLVQKKRFSRFHVS